MFVLSIMFGAVNKVLSSLKKHVLDCQVFAILLRSVGLPRSLFERKQVMNDLRISFSKLWIWTHRSLQRNEANPLRAVHLPVSIGVLDTIKLRQILQCSMNKHSEYRKTTTP